MKNILEFRYPVKMDYELEMKAHEFNPKFRNSHDEPRYVKVDPNDRSRTFLTTWLRVDIEVVLLHFSYRNYVHYHELMEEFRKRELRSLEFHEHLSFNMKFPKEAGEFTVISFGSALQLHPGFKSGLITGPYPGICPNLRWNAVVPNEEDFFSTGGNPKFYFACTIR